MYDHMTQYPLIAADKPYNGALISTATYNAELDEFFVDFSSSLHNANQGNLTVAEYAEKVAPCKVITWDEWEALEAAHESSLITLPTEITEDAFYYALEVLPPSRWYSSGGFEFFYVPERIRGSLVNWYFSKGGKYYTFVDSASLNDIQLRQRFAEV